MKQKNQRFQKRVFRAFVLLATLFAFIGVSAGVGMAAQLEINASSENTSNQTTNVIASKTSYSSAIHDLDGYDSLAITSATFKNNKKSTSDGIVLHTDNTGTSFTTTIKGTTLFEGNEGNNQGIICNTRELTFAEGSNVTFNLNKTTMSNSLGGAIGNGDTITFEKGSTTNFTSNTAGAGGAIYNQNGIITFKEGSTTNFTSNTASTYGGAIANSGTIKFYGKTTFSDNKATTYGGAILNNLGTIEFYGNTSFSDNKVGSAEPYTANDIENADATLNFYDGSITTFSNGGGITGAYKAGTIYFYDGATITMNDLDWKGEKRDTFKTLNISNQNFNANGGTFVINTDLKGTPGNTGDTITLTNCNIATSTLATPLVYVQVAYDPTAVTGQSVTGSHIFLTTNNSETITVTAKPYDYSFNGTKLTITPTVENGEGTQEASDTWKIVALTVTGGGGGGKTVADETTKSVSDTANLMNFAWFQTVNNLQKRLGDLRGGEASNMAWARFQRNNDDVNVGRSQSLSGNLYQIGYDFLIKSNDVAKNYFGLSVDVFDGSQSFEIGGGDAKSTTLSAYYTKVYESGHYFDFIFRYGRYESDTQSYDASVINPQLTKLDYAMNSVSLSGEYGYRANLGKSGLYLEPQAEFIYGYLAGTQATSSTGILADIDSTNHFLTRLGLAFGQRVKNFNYYLRGSYYHDFAGTTNVKYGDANYKQDGAENWWEVTLGGGWNISKVSYFYAELTKHFKDISNSLNFNVGFRFTL